MKQHTGSAICVSLQRSIADHSAARSLLALDYLDTNCGFSVAWWLSCAVFYSCFCVCVLEVWVCVLVLGVGVGVSRCGFVCPYARTTACICQRTTCGSSFSHSMWVLEIELRLPGLGAHSFTCQVISVVLPSLLSFGTKSHWIAQARPEFSREPIQALNLLFATALAF